MWKSGVKAVGSLVKALRVEAGWNQTELAKNAGIPRNAIANIEIGRRNLSIDQLLLLAGALQVEPSLLLDVYRFPKKKEELKKYYHLRIGSRGLTDDKLRVLAKFLKQSNVGLQNSEKILDLLIKRDELIAADVKFRHR